MVLKHTKVLVLLICFGVFSSVSAQSLKQKGFYAGIQSSSYAYGLSGKMDFTDKITGQAIIGFLGTINSYTARGLYKFKQDRFYDVYAFGALGLLTWDGHHSLRDRSESVISFGAGGGVEYDLRGLDSNFIPLFVNVELQATMASFDYYDFGYMALGLGFHYKF